MTGVILLAAHVLVCAAIYTASRRGALRTTSIVMPVVIFIPFWGAACVLLLHFGVLKCERIPLDYDRLEMTDEIYSAISISQSDDGQDVVPMEEALLLDSPRQCREMILDMLMEKPDRYLPQFQKIRDADDVEVVHYTTTIMIEISKRYEAQWQRLDRKYTENPGDMQALDNCCAFLKEYLAADLRQGYARQILLTRYIELLETRFHREPELHCGVELAENLMLDGNFARAKEILDLLLSKWKNEGEVWMALLRYYIRQKQGGSIQETIALMDALNITLSAHEREAIAFWKS